VLAAAEVFEHSLSNRIERDAVQQNEPGIRREERRQRANNK
jgi:hypothetical protein